MDPRELKLEQMENKLKKMEDYVLDDTVKYYNAQEGMSIHQFPISRH